MTNTKEKVFWSFIETLDNVSVLPHVMIVGSWAEFLYPHYFGDKFLPNWEAAQK